MAVTLERSDLFTNIAAAAPLLNRRPGQIILIDFTHTQGAAAGDPNSTIEVWRIPAGMKLWLWHSKIRFAALTAGRLFSMGYRAYTEQDGTAVAANLTGLWSALDVSAAGVRDMIEAPTLGAGQTNGCRVFKGNADLVIQITGGTIAAGSVTSGVLAVSSAGT